MWDLRFLFRPPPKQLTHTLGALGLIGLMGLGILLLQYNVSALWRQHEAAATWRPVTATMLEATKDPGHLAGGWRVPIRVYPITIRYTYTVDGGAYTCDRLAPWTGRLEGIDSWARAQLTRYRPGQQCQAFVNPRNPSEAFLIRDVNFRHGSELAVLG